MFICVFVPWIAPQSVTLTSVFCLLAQNKLIRSTPLQLVQIVRRNQNTFVDLNTSMYCMEAVKYQTDDCNENKSIYDSSDKIEEKN